MKKVFLLLIAAVAMAQVRAQNINPEVDYVPGKQAPKSTCDNLCSGWVIDINASGGVLMQDYSTVNPGGNYTNSINSSISTPKFKNGVSRGLDLQVGYFFGRSRKFGIGTGLFFMYQQGDLQMDRFHTEYQSTDYFGNTFRQVLTSNGRIRESVGISNLNIPLVFKYRTWFTQKVGFILDAGVLINVMERNEYNTDASFDYEAIYKYTGRQGEVVTVYDNSPTPAQGDLLILKNEYATTHTSAQVQEYFNSLSSKGYNVGLGVKPRITSGYVNYDGSAGVLVRPQISFSLTDKVSLNLGLYYIYQGFNHNAPANYRITDQSGSYNPMLNSVSSSANNSLGVNIGFRYCFCKSKPKTEPEPEPTEPETPPAPAPSADTSVVASPAEDEEEPEEVHMDMSTPILFDIDKTEIKPQYYPVLEDAVEQMKVHRHTGLVIHGYADNTGTPYYNKGLSKRRAVAVKSYLKAKGVKPRLMKVAGHGSKDPAASNSTAEGRMKNRRVVMKLKK